MSKTNLFSTCPLLLTFFLSIFAPNKLFAAPPQQQLRHHKLYEVLRHLRASDDYSYYDELKIFKDSQTYKGFETLLKFIDPRGYLKRYIHWNEQGVRVFLDRDTKTEEDFFIPFKQNGAPKDPKGLVRTLKNLAQNSNGPKPLTGFRIALDPGHMGGEVWDKITGKYVAAGGNYVSEGTITLHTCLLLKQTLEQLGAQVLVTRSDLTPVSKLDYKSFELDSFAREEIRANSDQPWFDELLRSHPLGPQLFKAAENHPAIKNYFEEGQRSYYFIHRADLAPRAEMINAFKPHLTLVVHFDATKVNQTQEQVDVVRGFVPGNYMNKELSSRKQRYQALRPLLDGHRWVESSVFTGHMVRNIAKHGKITIKDLPEDTNAIRVAAGVYARNLALNAMIEEGAFSYLEVLCYDHGVEHRRLSKLDRSAEIDGLKIAYSSRLDEIVIGMKQGILDYVESLRNNNSTNNPLP